MFLLLSFLVNPNDDETFFIDPQNGKLYLTRPLDSDNIDNQDTTFVLRVWVTDDNDNYDITYNDRTVTVTVNDVDDQLKPYFKKGIYFVNDTTVTETSTVSTFVYDFSDQIDDPENGPHAITKAASADSFFEIISDQLQLADQWESPDTANGHLYFTDLHVDRNNLKSYSRFYLYVNPENNHAPTCTVCIGYSFITTLLCCNSSLPAISSLNLMLMVNQ